MSKKRKWYASILVFTLTFLLFQENYLASAAAGMGPDAVADIMNNERFHGAISSIKWLTNLVDHYFTMAITATGFFIISSALLKNACAGAVLAFPKFWTGVHQAHEEKDKSDFKLFSRESWKGIVTNMSIGTIKSFIFRCIPDLMALTDFDNDDDANDPKRYWTKAIPQMVLCIIIGVFIYNGYYRDTAATVGNIGSEICNRVFSSINAASLVDSITQTTETPPSIWKGDNTLEGQMCFSLSQDIYKAYLNASKLQETDLKYKTALMRDCEVEAQTIINNAFGTDGVYSNYNMFSDLRKYDYTLTGIEITTLPAANAIAKENDLHCTDEEEETLLTLTGCRAAPTCTTGYIDSDNANYYFTLTFNGKKSDASNHIAKTEVVATQGNWGGFVTGPITVPVTLDSERYNDNGGVKTANSNALMHFNWADYKPIIEEAIRGASDDFSTANGCAVNQIAHTFNGWNAGTAQTPMFKLTGYRVGETYQIGTLVTTAVLTIPDGQGGQTQEELRFVTSVNVTLRAQ